jgi:hypothetical protein
VTYCYGFGSADPYLWLTYQDSDPTADSDPTPDLDPTLDADPTLDSDPDLTPAPAPDPGIFVSDLQDKKS